MKSLFFSSSGLSPQVVYIHVDKHFHTFTTDLVVFWR